MDFSFQEKSMLGSLLITVGVFAVYFPGVVQVLGTDPALIPSSMAFTLIGVVVTVVVVEIGFAMQLYYYRRGV